MSSHTPGPWNTSAAENGTVFAMEQPAGERLIAYLPSNHREAANAQLIAAAPDLLAALRDLMPQMAECDWIYSDRQEPLCPFMAARVAIVQATRGSNA